MHRRKKGKGSDWTPYGHEKARRQALIQRHAWLAVGALAVALVYGIFLGVTFSVESDVDSGGSVEVRQQEQKPMTVTVSPGRTPGFASSQAQEPEGMQAPSPEREEEGFLASTLRPFFPVVAPLVGALWLLSRVGASARGRLAELNFGVYKGAMPYEMHTVRRQKLVFTHRQVDAHIFGKLREDFLAGSYLHDPPISVRRLLGSVEVEEADVTRLRQGAHHDRPRRAGGRPTPRRSAPPAATPAARIRDGWDEEGFPGLWRAVRREQGRRSALRRRVKKAHELNQARRQERLADGQ